MGDANLEEVYKLYFGDVYLFALKLSKNEVIAEDITSETFMKAMAAMDQFEGKLSALPGKEIKSRCSH